MEKKRRENNSQKFPLGDNLYYSQLAIEKNRANYNSISKALQTTTRNALRPYYNFLNNAINTERKIGSYEVSFKTISSEKNIINIEPVKEIIEVNKGDVKLLLEIPEGAEIKDEKNRLVLGKADKIIEMDQLTYSIKGNIIEIKNPNFVIKEGEVIKFNLYCKNPVKYHLEGLDIKKDTQIVDKKGNKIEFTILDSTIKGWTLKINYHKQKEYKLFIGNKELSYKKYPIEKFTDLYDGKNKLEFKKLGDDIELENIPKSKTLSTESGFLYSWKKVTDIKKQEYKIQLFDDNQNNDFPEKSKIDYFFDDETTSIKQGEKGNLRTFQIKKKISDENILILKRDYKNKFELDENKPIKIDVNVSNLYRQRNSTYNLNKSPVGAHRNLIKLFENKEKVSWPIKKEYSDDIEYQILNPDYDGFTSQDNFIRKAMVTDDFAILEGPPGSGKTTVILELILQLLKKGNTVLLTASTHVAVDNVLEKIKELKSKGLAKYVEPLRIGDKSRVDDTILEYQFDSKLDYLSKNFEKSIAEQLIIDGSNLVCGTTMGIQQYPEIKNRDINSPYPIVPKFDYMIIDEASKTTFQEFLVPALYAKKWILAGDIKQLSPYIEQTNIIHNLELSLEDYEKNTIHLIFEALSNDKNKNFYAIGLTSDEIIYANEFFTDISKKNMDYMDYCGKNITFLDKSMKAISLLDILGSDLILFEKSQWNSIKKYIPKTFIVINENIPDSEDFLFNQFYLAKNLNLKYHYLHKTYRDQIEVSKAFLANYKEQSWAEAISWRMIRVYERRMLKDSETYYEKSYKALKPANSDKIDLIYNMTLSSILESLQKGNGQSSINITTITGGFSESVLKSRHETLTYQYRMHKEISKFSRTNFYDNKALLNSDKTNRDWSYKRYKKRNVWIDVPETKKNLGDRIHLEEVDRTMEELKAFVEYANNHHNPLGKVWTVAIITFYIPQESRLRESLRKYCNQPSSVSRFKKGDVDILNYTVDKFQGREADIVFINMVRREKVGFLDNINRLNVALTRARFQRVILGSKKFFIKCRTPILESLVKEEIGE